MNGFDMETVTASWWSGLLETAAQASRLLRIHEKCMKLCHSNRSRTPSEVEEDPNWNLLIWRGCPTLVAFFATGWGF